MFGSKDKGTYGKYCPNCEEYEHLRSEENLFKYCPYCGEPLTATPNKKTIKICGRTITIERKKAKSIIKLLKKSFGIIGIEF